MTIAQIITELPPSPNRTSGADTYDTDADVFLNGMEGLPIEMNIWRGQVNALALTLNQNASDAADDAQAASDDADDAEVFATQAALSAAASATTGINVDGYDFGAKLRIVDDGQGNKILALDSGVDQVRHITVTGTTPALDMSAAGSFHILLTGATTFSFDFTGLGDLTGRTFPFTLIVDQGATAYGISWPANVKWDNDTEPTPPAALQSGVYVGLYEPAPNRVRMWLTQRSAA